MQVNATTSFPSSPPSDAGRMIRAWRQRAGLTQEDLAEALSVTVYTVSRWENGHVVPSNLVWRALRQLAEERDRSFDERGGVYGGVVVAMALAAILGIVGIVTSSHGDVDANRAIIAVVLIAALALGVPKGIELLRSLWWPEG
jgi:transcriptional regulator with XRE-family HTH domain